MSAKPIATAIALIFGVSAIGAHASAPGDAGQAPAATGGQAQVKPEKDRPARRVCRNEVPIGSRLSVRTCRSATEWEDQARRSSDDLLTQQRDGIREDPKPQPD